MKFSSRIVRRDRAVATGCSRVVAVGMLAISGCHGPTASPTPPSQPVAPPTPAPAEPAPEPPASEEATPLAAARDVLREHPEVSVHHRPSSAPDPASTLWVRDDGSSTLCVTESERQRCFAGTWTNPSEYTVRRGEDDGSFCISDWATPKLRGWSFDMQGGPLRRDCGTSRIAAFEGELPTPAEPSEEIRGWPQVRIEGLGAGSAVLLEEGAQLDSMTEQVCWRSPDGLLCETPRAYESDAIMEVEHADLRVRDGWLSIRRSRTGFGGAEGRIGDDALLLYDVRGATLKLHGILPLGGHYGEREGEGHVAPDCTWLTTVASSEAVLEASGCVQVVTTVERRTSACGSAEAKRHPHTLEPVASTVSGADWPVYEGVLGDVTGAWMPTANGGFERVASCDP